MNIFYFDKDHSSKETNSEVVGLIGDSCNTLASLKLNIVPSFFISADCFKTIDSGEGVSDEVLQQGVQFIEEKIEKKLGDTERPLFLEVFLAPSLYLDIHKPITIGFTKENVEFLAGKFSDDFIYKKYKNFLLEALRHDPGIASISKSDVEDLNKLGAKESCDSFIKNVKNDFFSNPYIQLNKVINFFQKKFYSYSINKEIPCALGIKAVFLDQYNIYSGTMHTRNTSTGVSGVQGEFIKNLSSAEKQPLEFLPQSTLKELTKISVALETHFKEIRTVEFFISQQPLIWIDSEDRTVKKSAKASIKLLSDLHSRHIINDDFLLKNISDKALSNLLFPVFSENSTKKLGFESFGEIGSMGVARGRVFFSTESLLRAYKDAVAKKEDTNVILCMKATYAGDVEAIELGVGVICSAGGYASHAPVVARSLGKPAILGQELNIGKNSVKIGKQLVKEGDYISMEVPSVGIPKVYFGKAELQETDANNKDLQKIITISTKKIQSFQGNNGKKFDILANADTPVEIAKAVQFGADGVGLCRTEHMFFEKERINYFRLLLISEENNIRQDCLEKLKEFQKSDFLEIFKVLKGRPLTVRMLDAPLHEFIPNNSKDIKELQEILNKKYSIGNEDINEKFQRLKDINPMLGNRGCRFGISFPGIYEMQETALIEAACEYYTISDENQVNLKVMFPLVGLMEEFNFLNDGKNLEDRVIVGFKGVVSKVLSTFNFNEPPFTIKIGVMIEVPSAAISANQIAEKAEFFSYGTNDLVQMTYGLSRDDINSFYPAYTQYDIVKENPFTHLLDAAKKLVIYSVTEGRLKRPDLYTSICGEHAANADTVNFCIKNNINAVSCSNFSLPIVKLVAAQHFIN